MKIEVIDTGYFFADGGAMFGAIPKSAWKRRYPCDDENRCRLAIRSLLIQTDEGRVILIDTGVSETQQKELRWYGFTEMKSLKEELFQRGVQPEDVTDVILTHLHFDHCGNHFFPHATYWISYRQWQNILSPHPLEAASFYPEELLTIPTSHRVEFIKEAKRLCPQVNLRLFDGHTSGQLVIEVTGTEYGFLYAGDVIPLAANVSPEWISAYDLCAQASYDAKAGLLEEAVKERKGIFYCHDAYTLCTTIKKVGAYFKPAGKIVI